MSSGAGQVSTARRGGGRAAGIGAAIGAALFWGGHFVVAGEAIAETDPWTLSLLRWVPAAVILLAAAAIFERPDWRAVGRKLPWLGLLGLLGMFGFGTLMYLGLETSSAVNASLVGGIGPVLIATTAAIVLRERVGWRVIVGLAVGLVGVLIVISHGSIDTLLAFRFNPGDLWILGAVASWTAYTVLGRRPTGIPPLTTVGVQAAIVSIVLVPFVAVAGWHPPHSAAAWWGVAFIVLLPSVGSYLLWNFSVRRIPASLAGLFLNLIPVFTVLVALAMGRVITWPQAVGGIVIIAGVLFATVSIKARAAK